MSRPSQFLRSLAPTWPLMQRSRPGRGEQTEQTETREPHGPRQFFQRRGARECLAQTIAGCGFAALTGATRHGSREAP